jgi:hypothetical protein
MTAKLRCSFVFARGRFPSTGILRRSTVPLSRGVLPYLSQIGTSRDRILFFIIGLPVAFVFENLGGLLDWSDTHNIHSCVRVRSNRLFSTLLSVVLLHLELMMAFSPSP